MTTPEIRLVSFNGMTPEQLAAGPLPDFGVPDEWPGPEEEKRANYQTHSWGTYDGQTMCGVCEAKSWHVAAQWPCGTEPTRHPARKPADNA
jgi:hypothetical protein